MYAYERFNSWLHRRVMNRRYPESTLMLILHIWQSQIEIKVIFHYIWSVSPSSAHYSTELLITVTVLAASTCNGVNFFYSVGRYVKVAMCTRLK